MHTSHLKQKRGGASMNSTQKESLKCAMYAHFCAEIPQKRHVQCLDEYNTNYSPVSIQTHSIPYKWAAYYDVTQNNVYWKLAALFTVHFDMRWAFVMLVHSCSFCHRFVCTESHWCRKTVLVISPYFHVLLKSLHKWKLYAWYLIL